MNRILTGFCLFAFSLALLVCSNLASAQEGATLSTSAPKGRVAEIEAYAAEIDQFVKGNLKTERHFANFATGANYEVSAWRELKSDDERQNAESDPKVNEIATTWLRDGKVVGVRLYIRSAGNESTQDVMYYFRINTTLAKSDSRLNAVAGGISVRRQDYYDSKATVLRGTTECRDLKTLQSKPCGDFQDKPAPYYQTVKHFPFYGLLK